MYEEFDPFERLFREYEDNKSELTKEDQDFCEALMKHLVDNMRYEHERRIRMNRMMFNRRGLRNYLNDCNKSPEKSYLYKCKL